MYDDAVAFGQNLVCMFGIDWEGAISSDVDLIEGRLGVESRYFFVNFEVAIGLDH